MKFKLKTSTKRRIRIVLLTAISGLAIIGTTVFLCIHTYINKMNLVTTKAAAGTPKPTTLQPRLEAINPYSEDAEAEAGDIDPNATDSPIAEISSLEEEIKHNMEKDSIPIVYDKNVFNILLIGSDIRKEGETGRSDAIALVSVNKKTGKIIITSFLRDIYLQIPGRSNNRINAAYAFGGADLLMNTIEQNFKLPVKQYASIDFYSFMDVVDAVGGVTIDVTEEEIPVMNGYIRELNQLTGNETEAGCITKAGTWQLNGKQALAYARNRYVGNGDFDRVKRQRAIMKKVFEKVKGLNLLQLKDLLDVVLPKITTNLSERQIFSLILELPTYADYGLEQWSIPTADTYKEITIHKMSVLGINFKENINKINERIYGSKNQAGSEKKSMASKNR